MSTGMLLMLLAVGLMVGVISGMLGIGGAVILIPVLVFGFGFTQRQAIGTSLGMMLPPIGVFAFLIYWRAGEVNGVAATMLAMGFAVGAYVGGRLVVSGAVPEQALRLLFGFFLVYLATNVILRTDRRAYAVVTATLAVVVAAGGFALMRVLGRRVERRLTLDDAFTARLDAPVAPDYEI